MLKFITTSRAGIGFACILAGIDACSAPIGRRPSLAGSTESDSTRAVQVAVAAYNEGLGSHATRVQVATFLRDTAGILISLVPKDSTSRGGGALVRVPNVGPARVLEWYQ